MHGGDSMARRNDHVDWTSNPAAREHDCSRWVI
jgi:hypothetical protein